MATCTSTTNLNNFDTNEATLSHDTSAHLSRLHDDFQWDQLSANMGIEQGKDFWEQRNGTIFLQSGGAANGSWFAKFRGDKHAYNSYMHQTIRVWDGDQAAQTRARMEYKRQLATATTTVGLRVYAKPLDDDNPASTNCDYLSGLDHPDGNRLRAGQPWVKINDTGIANVTANSWTLERDEVTTDEWVSAHDPIPGGLGDGLELQIRAHGKSIRPDGTRIAVHFDNIRVEGQYS